MALTAEERAAILKRQKDTDAAIELALEMIPREDLEHWYFLAEFGGCNKWLDRIQSPRGDDRSQRELLIAAAVELLRRATAPVPERVKVVERFVAKKPSKKPRRKKS